MSEPVRHAVENSPDLQRSSAVGQLLDRPVSAAELAAGADLAAQPAAVHGTRRIGLLVFRLGEELAAVPATMLLRVTPVTRSRPIPGVGRGVMKGLCNIRGELVLCADLHRLLGLPLQHAPESSPAASSQRRCMVVIGHAEDSWAFEVDVIVGVVHVDPAGIRPPPVTVEFAIGSYTTGLATVDDQHVTVLDGDRILAGFRADIS